MELNTNIKSNINGSEIYINTSIEIERFIWNKTSYYVVDNDVSIDGITFDTINFDLKVNLSDKMLSGTSVNNIYLIDESGKCKEYSLRITINHYFQDIEDWVYVNRNILEQIINKKLKDKGLFCPSSIAFYKNLSINDISKVIFAHDSSILNRRYLCMYTDISVIKEIHNNFPYIFYHKESFRNIERVSFLF